MDYPNRVSLFPLLLQGVVVVCSAECLGGELEAVSKFLPYSDQNYYYKSWKWKEPFGRRVTVVLQGLSWKPFQLPATLPT